MRAVLSAALLCCIGFTSVDAAEWRADFIPMDGHVTAVEGAGVDIRIATRQQSYRLAANGRQLELASPLPRAAIPQGGLPDGRVAVGETTIARAWLAGPTRRYGHGVLGDAIEAGSLEIALRDGRRRTLRLDKDAVFEDLTPRVVNLDGSEKILTVKSYLDRGSALALIDPVSATIIAETPPIGRPYAWLNPAGVADFNGDGDIDIALVRQPHVVGQLEVWSWRNGRLEKTSETSDVSNHFIGSRALGMSAVADFNGDKRPDLAIPSLNRRTLRLLAFDAKPHDIARIALPARIATNIGLMLLDGRPALVMGLEDGRLVLIHD